MTSPLTIAQPGASPRLRPEHLEHLRRSGLTDATIQAAGIYSVAPEEARRLGFVRGVAGIAFPYPSTEVVVDGVTHPYTRLRVDEGRVRRSGLKYENPLRDRIERGLTFYPYVPTAVAALRRDAARPLVLTEGEKKALALTQEGFPAIGLPGVHMFADPTSRQAPGRKPLHPELRRWAWRGRCVYVCFDSDRVEKDGVALACERLCAALTREGAAVRVVRLPSLPGLAKTGADDFLVREGRAAFQALVDAAGPWEPFAWVVDLLPASLSPEALPAALDPLRGHVAGASHTELRTVAQRLAARFPPISSEAALRLLVPSEASVAPDAPPQVVTSGRQLREVVADAWAALLSSPFRDRVFRHGEALVYAGDEAGAVVGRSPLQPLDDDLLAKVVSLVATGAVAQGTSLPRSEEEIRKKLTATLAGGPSVVLLDNIAHALDSESMAAVLTSEVWSDRLLGQTRMVHLPNRALWLATGNNPVLSRELARRAVRIRLDASLEQPWLRAGFRHPDLEAWTLAERPRLVAALITLVRGWIADGRPEGDVGLGSFEGWSRLVGGRAAERWRGGLPRGPARTGGGERPGGGGVGRLRGPVGGAIRRALGQRG